VPQRKARGTALRPTLVGPRYDSPPYDSTSDSDLSFRNLWEGFRSPSLGRRHPGGDARGGSPENGVDGVMHPFDRIGITATRETVADSRQLGYRYADTDTSATLDAALLATDQRSLMTTIKLACHLPGAA
jgi:hypothetical protein